MLSSGGVGADMMSDAARDPAIKLFGRTIAVPESQSVDKAGALCDPSTVAEASEDEKDMCQELIGGDAEDSTAENPDEDHSAQDVSSCLNGANSAGQENGRLAEESKPENDQAEPEVSPQEKVLKKPDKILPCPRCNSLDTKFCYYNNYNVNQPRHFCKNCQRYWTAGGTMRNVPVGAGRRKNKHSASHYHQLVTSSESMSPPQLDVPDFPSGQSSRHFNGNRAVLKFGPEAPLCESMVSVLSLRNQKKQGHVSLPTCNEKEKEPSCASSVTAPNHLENEASENVAQVEENAMHSYCNGITPVHPLHCYPGPPWAFPWSPSWNDVSAMAASRCSDIAYGQENGNANPIPWTPTPMMAAAPAFVAPTVPFPFIPASFWGCMASWPDGAWKVPWVGAGGGLSPSSSASNSGCLGSHPPRLGKHSRDVTPHAEEKVEKSLWAPKTLRIDDPEEAAKSSIWATLGIKHDQNESMAKSGIFKSFQPRSEDKAHQSDVTQVLYANPAALSRSQTFQESN